MIDLKLLNINLGDSQQDISNKLNYNFSKIIQSGEGAYGRIGDDGPVGSDGPSGITGPYGPQGFRGSQWYIDQNEPNGATAGDLWVNLPNDCEVYKYEEVDGSLTWVSQGFTLAQSGVFEISHQTGLTSGQPTSAYVQNLFLPQTRTLVLDDLGEERVKNPQLSKIVLGIPGVGPSAAYPFLEFSKSTYQGQNSFSDRTPKFYGINKLFPGAIAAAPNYLYLRANDGINIDVKGLKMTYKYLDLSTGAPASSSTEADYYGGITGSFSNDIVFNLPVPQTQTTTFSCNTGTTSANNPSVWNVQASNVTNWTTFAFNGNLSLYSTNNIGGTGTPRTSFNVGEFRYTRSKPYVVGENVFRARYKGSPSFLSTASLTNLANNLDLYVVDSDGTNKFSKKTSAFLPNPGLANAVGASYARTGSYSCTSPSIASKDYYTILATMDWYNQSSTFSRWSVGDTFFIDVDLDQTRVPIFGIFLSSLQPQRYGLSSLLIENDDTATFRIVCPTGQGFHGIFVEVAYSGSPSASPKTFSNTDNTLNFFGGDSSYTSYANVIEITILRKALGTYRVYWKAIGGTLGGIMCGCVTNEA